jgi:hypothetical protein
MLVKPSRRSAVLNGPLTTVELQKPPRAGLFGGQVGDAEHRDRGDVLAVQAIDVPFDEQDLAGVREPDVSGCGQHLDGADLLAAVASVVGHPPDGRVLPGQGVELVEQSGLVPGDGQHVVRATPVQVEGVFALAVHRIAGGDRTG